MIHQQENILLVMIKIKCWITEKSIMVYGAAIKILMVIFIIMLIFLKNK